MVDLFNEVSEDLRRDRLNRFWARFGVYIIALAVLVVLATAGWRGWEYWRGQQAAAAADRYLDAVQLAETGDHAAAAEAFAAIAADAPSGYAVLAKFRRAAELAAGGDGAAALEAYSALASDGGLSSGQRDLARLRGAMIAVDDEDHAAFKDRLAPLLADGNPWKAAASELLAVSAIRAEQWQEARDTLSALVAADDTPGDLRSRAEILLTVVVGRIGPAEDAEKEGSGS